MAERYLSGFVLNTLYCCIIAFAFDKHTHGISNTYNNRNNVEFVMVVKGYDRDKSLGTVGRS